MLVKQKTLLCSFFAFLILVAESTYQVVTDRLKNTFSGKNSSLGIYTFIAAQTLLVYYLVGRFRWAHSEILLKL